MNSEFKIFKFRLFFKDLYYSGESSTELAHSLTCPICGRLGYTESELQSHVTSEHQNSNTEVVRSILNLVQIFASPWASLRDMLKSVFELSVVYTVYIGINQEKLNN